MLILLIFSICLSIPIIDLYNSIAKNKIKNYIFAILFVSTLQIVTTTLIGFMGISTYAYQMIITTYCGFFIILFILILIFKIMRDKNNIELNNIKSKLLNMLKQKSILYICLIIFIIISLFQTNIFDDTLYYFEVSNGFSNGLYPNSYTYIIPGSYYFYGALSQGFVVQWYYIFTPISFFIILTGIVNDYVSSIFTSKYKYLQIFSILFFITLFSIFIAPTMISGNLYISGCLIGIYMICIKQKDYRCSSLVLIVAQFFSATGVILSCALVISTFIYFLVYKGMNNILKLTPWYMVPLYSVPLLILSFLEVSYGSIGKTWAYIFICVFFLIVALFIIINYLLKKREIKNDFLKFSLINVNWFSSSIMKYIILFISLSSMIVIFIYLQSFYSLTIVYSMIPLYAMLFLILPLIIINYTKQYKDENNINLILLINMSLVSFIFILLWTLNINNDSIWRMVMLLPTMSIGESLISYLILFSINISLVLPFFNSIEWKWIHKFNLFKSRKGVTITLSSIVIVAGTIPSTIVAINPAMTNFLWNKYSANIEKNINLFSENDITKMVNLSRLTSKTNWSYVFDNPSSAYISIEQNANYTYRFYESLFYFNDIKHVSDDIRNNPISALGFYQSRLIFSSQKNKIIVNQSLEEFGDWLNIYLNSNNWTNLIDVIFLSKSREYYKYINLDLSGHIIYDSNLFEDITVITKNQEILNTIKNSI